MRAVRSRSALTIPLDLPLGVFSHRLKPHFPLSTQRYSMQKRGTSPPRYVHFSSLASYFCFLMRNNKSLYHRPVPNTLCGQRLYTSPDYYRNTSFALPTTRKYSTDVLDRFLNAPTARGRLSLAILSDALFVVLDRNNVFPSSQQRHCLWTLLVLYTFHSTSA